MYIVTSPPIVRISVVVKSIEPIVSQCALRNVAHDVFRFRSGAGSIPLALFFGHQIINRLLLAAIDPSGNAEHQKMPGVQDESREGSSIRHEVEILSGSSRRSIARFKSRPRGVDRFGVQRI